MSTFISYAREDRDVAWQVARDLRAAGIEVWIDHDIRPGEQWDQAVQRALDHCADVVVILTPDSVQSQSVMDEIAYALDGGRNVVPVMHRTCNVPLRLRRLQYVDLQSYDDGIASVIGALRGSPAKPEASAAPFPQRKPRRLRMALIFAAFGALYGAVCQMFILQIDSTMAGRAHFSIGTMILLAAVIDAVLLSIAGAIAGDRRAPVIAAIIGCALVAILWRVSFGSYADTVLAGRLWGGPGGAIAGAIAARVFASLR